MVERLHLELQGMFRTIRSCLEGQYRMKIPTHHPSLSWLFRHVSWFLIDQRDQKTAYQRQHQRLDQRPLVTSPDPHKQRFKYEAGWGYGIYLGRAMDSEEHLVGCRTAGVVRCRTVRRRPIEEQFDQQMMLALHGTPWDAKGRLATPVPTMGAYHHPQQHHPQLGQAMWMRIR
eukprot:3695254-Amphidinium_carterae.1